MADNPALELSHISKRFGALAALDDVSLAVQPGEILALVGENGAGKSTLMNVAYGLYRADAGEIRIRGEVVHPRSPADAIARGVGMVHQHFQLVPPLTVAENVVLGREPTRGLQLDHRAAEEAVAKTARELGFQLDPTAKVASLSVGAQQRVEIVKALFRGAKILILDEPTAVLTPQEANELYAIARKLRDQGQSVLFISHKLSEVLAVADRVAVMARGRMVDVVNAREATAEALTAKMITAGPDALKPVHREPAQPGAVRLALANVESSGSDGLRGVSLQLRAGEILGIAGVAGNGQSALAEVATGLTEASAGKLEVDGVAVPKPSPAKLRELGVAHVPEDRQKRGLALDLTVAENAALGRQTRPPFARGIRIDAAGRDAFARTLIAEYDVRPPDPQLRARDLSGGNQQKVILGRELAGQPKVVIAVQPTRGLDVGAIANVHRHLVAARDGGAAVLLISMDLDEIRALSDRIAVMYGGKVVAELPAGASEAEIGPHMLGHA
ncbi:MAG: ABC transporter ATP-binding protein [Deltaproteobacteria bacterium]|nr:ABC transporter ATP-binding protein [Deltaproteobacteria bacterium]